MVTSQKMIEREMGNRGSKSVILENIAVKEQRVDGGLYGVFLPYIRYTLKGFERNYPVRILSNSINNPRFLYKAVSSYQPYFPVHCYSTMIPNRGAEFIPHPLWLTGFIDGECCFHISIYKNNNKVGWAVKIEFEIGLHVKDKALLEVIQKYIQVGNTFTNSREGMSFRIQSPKGLAKIVEHLDSNSLITQKLSDYVLFKEALNLISNKQHLTLAGLHEIVAIKAAMNLGLSESLKTAFPNVVPRIRPLANIPAAGFMLNPEWVAGFAAAVVFSLIFLNLQPINWRKECN